MEISFTIPMPPFSLNKYTYSDKRHKTREAREWESAVLFHLNQIPELLAAKEQWAAKLPKGFKVSYYAEYPTPIFFNAQDSVSSKTIDVTNYEKMLQDLIFGQVLGINDKLVLDMWSVKFPGKSYRLHITIQALDSLIIPAL